MAKITIKYTPVAEEPGQDVDNVCATFMPTNSYIDTEAYEGTVYDTNTTDNGMETMDEYLAKVINRPGIVNMIKQAYGDGKGAGQYEFEITDPYEVAYYRELATKFEGRGITIEVATA